MVFARLSVNKNVSLKMLIAVVLPRTKSLISVSLTMCIDARTHVHVLSMEST